MFSLNFDDFARFSLNFHEFPLISMSWGLVSCRCTAGDADFVSLRCRKLEIGSNSTISAVFRKNQPPERARTMPEPCPNRARTAPEPRPNHARTTPEPCPNHARTMSEPFQADKVGRASTATKFCPEQISSRQKCTAPVGFHGINADSCSNSMDSSKFA